MHYQIMSSNQQEEGVFTEKQLFEMAKNKDERINRKTLVRFGESEPWQTIAQCEDLESIREYLYKDADNLVWPKPPKQGERSAVLLSFLITGLGQVYLGQIAKGACIFLGIIVVAAFTLGIGAIPIWIAGMVDAHKIQKKLLSGQPVKKWEFF